MDVLLEGIVGSTAYGLAREGSDEDRLGVFVAPTEKVLGLFSYDESVVKHEPDVTYHEVAKYINLALKCNPTILELMWLDGYTQINDFGALLVGLRTKVLSESYVRNAYGGYATAQIRRLEQRNAEGKEGFSSDVKQRTAKHARHCFRLLRQGRELLETSKLTIRVPDPEFYWQFDDATVAEMTALFDVEIERFNSCTSILPSKPDLDFANDTLLAIRKAY